MCNVRNENARTYSPSMARCCPPLAAAHPRVSSLSFYPPFRKRSQTHILPLSPLIFPLIFLSLPPLSCSRSPSLHLDVVSVYQDRLEVAAAIFRWQHPPSLPPSFPPSLPPSLPLSISRSKSPPRLFAFSVYLPLFQLIRLSLATSWL